MTDLEQSDLAVALRDLADEVDDDGVDTLVVISCTGTGVTLLVSGDDADTLLLAAVQALDSADADEASAAARN